ncbi:hypothetical protein KEJ17_08155, partial [Candidatus Bathyarchaeota archaeon]|nr:hypothetical protein [Candidatus Bathyarchaeota archaeon]
VFLPPVYYPEEILGELRWVAIMFPTSNAAGLIRAYSGLATFQGRMILIRWLVFLLMMVASILLVMFKARWREI